MAEKLQANRLLWFAFILWILFILTGCSVFGKQAPAALPTVVLDNVSATPQSASRTGSGGVVASGIVVPAQQAQLASALGGNVRAVKVSAGDQVQAGQVLISLAGSEKLAAAIEAANLELLSAQQALKALDDQAGQARAGAQLRLANAQKALDDAQKHRTWKNYRNGSVNSVQAAQADVVVADNNLQKAQEEFDKVADQGEDDLHRATALKALTAARRTYDTAVANLKYLLAMPDNLDVAQAEAELQVAQAEVQGAQMEVDRLKDGPDPDSVALAQERIKNAQAQIQASQASLDDLDLKAPFAGTVVTVNIHNGEWVLPGQPLLVLADVQHLQVQTTDLSERDVPQVEVGQPVMVLVKALNQEVAGRVSAISPLADSLGGDVVYKTTLDLETPPANLRAGMSVEVTFEPSK